MTITAAAKPQVQHQSQHRSHQLEQQRKELRAKAEGFDFISMFLEKLSEGDKQ